jgi:hypothetical protein
MFSYPIISFPDLISKDINSEAYVEVIVGEKPIVPSKPTKQKTHEGCLIGFVFFAIAAIVASGAIPLGTSLPIGLGIALVLWIVYNGMGQSEYNANLKAYEKDYTIYKKENEAYLIAVKETKKHVNELIRRRDKGWKYELIQKNLKTYRFKLSSGYGKKGVSEDYFAKCLKCFFNCSIYQNSPIKCNSIGATYYPDIIMYFSKVNLAIAIEIDEPYKLKDGEPIHYYDMENNIPIYSDDEILNRGINGYLTSRSKEIKKEGFVLVRFAEKQVVTQPIPCCEYIYNEILKYTGIRLTEIEISSLHELNIINTWTYTEAREMHKNRFRENYLNTVDFSKYPGSEKLSAKNSKNKAVARSNSLRFDGLYQSRKESTYWNYIRFYNDGTVIKVCSTGEPFQISKWFTKEKYIDSNAERGSYDTFGNTMEIIINNSGVKMTYEGYIGQDEIEISRRFRTHKEKISEVYFFVPLSKN